MKIYISSTYKDLIEHRAAVAHALGQMDHKVVGMENYVAQGRKPLDVCLRDIDKCDLYVGIFAWRYGYVPDSANKDDPLPDSITASELRHAAGSGKRPLTFLLDEKADWPDRFKDAVTGENPPTRIETLRGTIASDFLVGPFTTPDDLARQVAAAVLHRIATDRIGDIELKIGSGFSESVLPSGGAISSSSMPEMPASLMDAQNPAALQIDLRDGKYWWSTRLFFLACVAEELSGTRLIIFTQNGDSFVGAATPATVRGRLAGTCKGLDEFELKCREKPVDRRNLAGALGQRCDLWSGIFSRQTESAGRMLVSDASLRRWLTGDLNENGVEQKGEDVSPAFLEKVMNWAHPFVPVTSGKQLKKVVDRAKLTERLATLFIEDLAEAYR